jgi:DNA polymerase-1
MFRAFFALPTSITDAEDRPVNALLGTTNLILWAIEQHSPRAVVLCDGAEAAVYRKELYPPYHADRPPLPDALGHQFAEAPAFFGAFGWTGEQHETLEADDLLGSFALAEAEAGGRALLYTGDRDMFQCVNDRVQVLFPRGAKDGPELIGPVEVRKRYGVDPGQVPDFIALRGDPSDGLPGARGIGEKTARDLLREHGTLEACIAASVRLRPRVGAACATPPRSCGRSARSPPCSASRSSPPPDRPTDWAGAATRRAAARWSVSPSAWSAWAATLRILTRHNAPQVRSSFPSCWPLARRWRSSPLPRPPRRGRSRSTEGWEFSATPTGPWKRVKVPHVFDGRPLERLFTGTTGWYRLRFLGPRPGPASPGRCASRPSGAGREVFLNGRQLGGSDDPYTPFMLPANGLRPGRDNLLTVRVDNRRTHGLPRGLVELGRASRAASSSSRAARCRCAGRRLGKVDCSGRAGPRRSSTAG